MIRPCNNRIMITLPVNQEYYLRKAAKKAGLKLSKFISLMLAKKTKDLANEFEKDYDFYLLLTEIAKAKWLDE